MGKKNKKKKNKKKGKREKKNEKNKLVGNSKIETKIVLPRTIDASDVTIDVKPPPNWTKDSLSEFVESAHRNRYATFINCASAFEILSEIDACFLKIILPSGSSESEGAWINPDNIITPLLFMRSHSAFRAACEHAMAGQIPESYPLVRVCIEYAGYALKIAANPELTEVWLRRHDDAEALKEVKRIFTISNVKIVVRDSAPLFAEAFDVLYERAIDFGGHPNERAITSSATLTDGIDNKIFMQAYLQGGGLQMDACLKTVAQSGVCSLGIFGAVFPARFMLLGVNDRIERLRNNL